MVALIAIAMSLYHMYVAAFGPPEALIFRGTHLMFALSLVFLLYPSRPEGGAGWRVLDGVLLLAGLGIVLHIFVNYQYYTNRIIYIDELTFADKAWAIVSVLVILEATRRVLGWALPLTAIVFLAYAPEYPGHVPGAAGADLPLHRGHLRLDARRFRLLRDAVRAVRRVHGAQRHRPAVHGLLHVHHRRTRRAAPARSRW